MLDALSGYDMPFATDIKVVESSLLKTEDTERSQCPNGYDHLFERVWPGLVKARKCSNKPDLEYDREDFNEYSRRILHTSDNDFAEDHIDGLRNLRGKSTCKTVQEAIDPIPMNSFDGKHICIKRDGVKIFDLRQANKEGECP